MAWIDILLFYTAVALYTWLSKRSIEKEKKYCNAEWGTAVFVLTFILFFGVHGTTAKDRTVSGPADGKCERK